MKSTGIPVKTNLYDIIQNPKEGITILESSRHASLFITSPQKMTYFRSVRNPSHLHFVFMTIIGVIREGFCCSPNACEPRKATFCSKSLDENTLVQPRG